jgi:hypothetical protein
MSVIAPCCPTCGDPGYLLPSGERYCGKADCPHTDPIEVGVEMVTIPASDWRGAVDLIRELHGILAPPEVDDPSAVPIAVDKIEAWLDAHGGQ